MQKLGALLLTLVIFGSVACKGCDDGATSSNNETNNNQLPTNNGEPDAGGQTNNGVWPDGCVDEDEDGYPVGLTCTGRVDCDDSNADVKPGAREECYDEVDNDCDGAVDEGCPDCDEGASRSCGSDEGECVAGTQTCREGVWSDCEGSQPGSEEVCNGVDDDCDGEVDENPGYLCDDGKMCNGVETCEAGACTTGEVIDCTALDGPCLTGECSEKDGGCRAFPKENGSVCDDGLFCTENGTCDAGECVTTPRDCSGEDDQCNEGVCDEAADSCVKQPRSDGTQCDDSLFCTRADVCTAGMCGGETRDCSSAADQCNDGVCDETADACVPQPIANGSTCDDGAFCTVGDTCQAGQCAGGGPRQCGAAGGSCREGVCDEAADSCTGDPVADGTSCDDGAFCTVADSCVAGNCMGGGPRNCSSADGLCKVGTCNENLNLCVPVAAPDNTICDDGRYCTVSDRCNSGSCNGTARSCANVADECNNGVCDETADACARQPKSDGTACPDALFCSVNEVCVAGSCTRASRDCSGAGDDCNDGICNETSDACAPQAKANGTVCNDGLFCTAQDACQSGTCTGGPLNCSNAGDQCQDGVCDEQLNSCTGQAKPNSTLCDDGRICTVSDSCQEGVCSGANLNCSAFADQCNNGLCNEVNGCYAAPKSNTTTCTDSSTCTTGDRCQNGVCVGVDVDCTPFADQCNDSSCVENMGCQPIPKTGNACNDSADCTVNDVCFQGTCVGDAKVCAEPADECYDAVCDESQNGLCINVNNGTCDACLTGTPTANAGGDQIVTPNTTVQLSSAGSSDPTNQALTYSWRIDSRPSGSTAQLSNSNAANPTLLGDVTGDFIVCLSVSDPDLCVSAEDCMKITVIPDDVDLHIELVWFSNYSDLDLHYQAPPYLRTDWFRALRSNGLPASCGRTGPQAAKGPDVFWCLRNPDWGGGPQLWEPDGIAANDPSLDVDNVTGYGPENINQTELFDGNPFTVGVHYYANSANFADPNSPSAGDVSARIRVYSNGTLLRETTRTMECRTFWEAATVAVSGGGTNVAVSLKNTVFSTPTNGLCRCNSNSDCFSGETCTNTTYGKICLQ